MALSELYRKIALLSPHMEVMLRKLYWKNVSLLKKQGAKMHAGRKNTPANVEKRDFEEVIDYLKSQGVGKGSLLIIHSSLDSLQCYGLDAEAIISRLLDLIGETGTLAMPAIRKFKNEPDQASLLKIKQIDQECVYKVRKSPVISGMLPYTLMLRADAETSLFPLNPMVAVGSLAKPMMKDNLMGEAPSPHGPHSAWKFCYDHDAIVVSLGVDLEHFNTSIHVAEEAFGDWHWSDDEWFWTRRFKIVPIDGPIISKMVKERRPQWGCFYLAELNLSRDLASEGIVNKIHFGDDTVVCVQRMKALVDYLRSVNDKGYPYFKH